jgi:hypothetical protein
MKAMCTTGRKLNAIAGPCDAIYIPKVVGDPEHSCVILSLMYPELGDNLDNTNNRMFPTVVLNLVQ